DCEERRASWPGPGSAGSNGSTNRRCVDEQIRPAARSGGTAVDGGAHWRGHHRHERAEMKFQIHKLQAPEKIQVPSANSGSAAFGGSLRFGASLELGAWSLELERWRFRQ